MPEGRGQVLFCTLPEGRTPGYYQKWTAVPLVQLTGGVELRADSSLDG